MLLFCLIQGAAALFFSAPPPALPSFLPGCFPLFLPHPRHAQTCHMMCLLVALLSSSKGPCFDEASYSAGEFEPPLPSFLRKKKVRVSPASLAFQFPDRLTDFKRGGVVVVSFVCYPRHRALLFPIPSRSRFFWHRRGCEVNKPKLL